jgi:hypothetical protein
MCLELLDDDLRATLALVKCLVVAGITRSSVPAILEAADACITAMRLLKVCAECAPDRHAKPGMIGIQSPHQP